MEFALYMLKACLALILFYGVYCLISWRDTFFSWKRVLLLSMLFFSAIYPLWTITLTASLDYKLPDAIIGGIPDYLFKEVTVYPADAATPLLSSSRLLLYIYGMGVAVFSIRMLIELISIASIIIRSKRTTIPGKAIYANGNIDTPFSFLNRIVINPEKHTESELREILLHEETHVRELHTLDMLISELYCIFFWFNPISWLVKREIRINLEYLADRKVLDAGCDSQHYQFHLLRLSYHKAAAKLTNNFNVSPLKQRILMMNKNRTHIAGLAKYAFFIPLAAMLLLFNCKNDTDRTNDETVQNQQDKTEIPDHPALTEDEILEFEEPDSQDKKKENIPPPKLTFERAEQMPMFPGGDAALYKWLGDNLIYPAKAAEEKIEGTVVLRFVVGEDGNIGKTEIAKGANPLLDAEALRVIKLLPKFTPGMQDGEPVAVWFTMPVKFKLS